MRTAYKQYRQLVARVEVLGQTIHQCYPKQVTCHAGCDNCCYQQFTIFPVEAHHLAQAAATLSSEARRCLQQHIQKRCDSWRLVDQAAPCVLLHRGRCSLYDGRPLICRVHGYPIYSAMIASSDDRRRDCCPRNFTDMALASINQQAIYNVDLLNQTLVAIHLLFLQEYGLPDRRVTMQQAVLQALQTPIEPPSEKPFLLHFSEGDRGEI